MPIIDFVNVSFACNIFTRYKNPVVIIICFYFIKTCRLLALIESYLTKLNTVMIWIFESEPHLCNCVRLIKIILDCFPTIFPFWMIGSNFFPFFVLKVLDNYFFRITFINIICRLECNTSNALNIREFDLNP